MLATQNQKGETATVESFMDEHDDFEALIREHQRMIHSLCYRMTGSMADAEDLVQETFINAYRHLSAFRKEARVSSWMCRIAMNCCLNWQKREQRLVRLHQLWSEQGMVREPASEDSARSARVQQALLQLKPKQRAAVVLTIYEGLTHAEAAHVLHCSETTISWRLFAARKRLKRLLKDLARGGTIQ